MALSDLLSSLAKAASKAYSSYSSSKNKSSSNGSAYSSSGSSYKPSSAPSSTAPWAKHVSYFGSPEAYAKTIMEREKSGQKLSDPAAAEAFKKAYPQYFQDSSQYRDSNQYSASLPSQTQTTSSGGGSSSLAKWGSALLGLAGAIPGVSPGLQTLLNTVTGGPGRVVQEFVSEKLPQAQAQAPQLPPQYIQQPVEMFDPSAILNEIRKMVEESTANVETLPIAYRGLEDVMNTINSIEQGIIQRFNELGQGVDPATQAAIASLRETVNQQRQALMEEMARRGLLQSGIWLEMEGRLNQGMLTEQQRLMANRLSDLQNQLNQALLSLGQARIQAASQFGAEQIRLAEAAAQRRQQALSSLLDAAMEAQKQLAQQQMDAQKLAWEREKYYSPSWTDQAQYTGVIPSMYPGDPSATIRYAQRMWGEANKAGDRSAMDYWHQVAEQARAAAGWPTGDSSGLATQSLMTQAGLPTWERQQAEQDMALRRELGLKDYLYGPTPYQQQELGLRREIGLQDYLYGPTPYQQQQLSLSKTRLAQAAAGAAQEANRLSSTEYIINARSQAAQGVQTALDELWRKTPGGPSYEAVLDTATKALNKARTDLTRAGLSSDDVNNTIETLKEYISASTGVPLSAFGW